MNKRKPGAPKGNSNAAKSHKIEKVYIRGTETQVTDWKIAAIHDGVELPDWIRRTLDAAAKRNKKK